jgi:hypothetical protein
MTAFNNRATMKEKVEQLRNDQRNASTLHQFAQSEAGEVGGRFAKPATVNASQQAVHYPRLPTSSPWANDPVPPEEPLGIDVSEAPIVGEPHEVLASQQPFSWMKDRPNTSASPVCVGGDDATAVSPSSPSGLPRPVDRDLGKGPHVASGEDEHGKAVADVLSSPKNSKSNLKRRLV